MDNRFTTTQTAKAIGIPADTLRTWMKRGWLDHILGPRESRTTGTWTHFTPGIMPVLQVAKEFAAFLHPHLAIQAAAICQPPIMQYLFEEKTRFRFVGIALFSSEGETMACPCSFGSLDLFESNDWSRETWASAAPDGGLGKWGPIGHNRPYMFVIIDLANLPKLTEESK